MSEGGFAISGLVLQGLTLFAVGFAAWQIVIHGRQMHRDFEALFVQRYWHLMDSRSRRFASGGLAEKVDGPVIMSYLQLCEDQIDCRRIGRVTDSTWDFWRGAIDDQASEPAYAAELARTRSQGRYPRLRTLLQSPETHDPLMRGRLWRWAHGL